MKLKSRSNGPSHRSSHTVMNQSFVISKGMSSMIWSHIRWCSGLYTLPSFWINLSQRRKPVKKLNAPGKPNNSRTCLYSGTNSSGRCRIDCEHMRKVLSLGSMPGFFFAYSRWYSRCLRSQVSLTSWQTAIAIAHFTHSKSEVWPNHLLESIFIILVKYISGRTSCLKNV